MAKEDRRLFLATIWVNPAVSGKAFITDVWVVGENFDDARQKARPWCGYHEFKLRALVDKGPVIP